MPYGTIKIDTITFTDGGVDKSVPVSGLVQNPTFTGNVTVTGTISGNIIQGGTTVSGLTVTGTTANFASGVFTTQISGVTITGTTVSTTTGNFTSLTGTTATITSGIIASGTAALPSLAILSDPNTGIYSPGADQLAVATNGVERLRLSSTGEFMFKGAGTTPGTDKAVYFSGSAPVNSVVLDSSGRLGIGTSSPSERLTVAGNIDLPNVNSYIKGGGHNVVQVDATRTYLYGGTNGIQVRSADNLAELINITNAGLVGIGTTTPDQKLVVSGSLAATGAGSFGAGNTAGAYLSYESGGEARVFARSVGTASDLSFWTSTAGGSSERARIDSSGRLLVGTSTARSNFFNSASSESVQLQVEGTNGATCSLASISSMSDTVGGRLYLAHQRSGAVGGNTILNNGDQVGSITFQGNDGGQFVECASITALIDNIPGADDMPCRLVFSTTADGASSPTGRAMIDNRGVLHTFAAAGGDGHLFMTGENAGTTYYLFAGFRNATAVSGASASMVFQVFTNGNTQNTNNSYAGISDLKLKENIVDATSQWDDLKALQVRKYNFKEETGHQTHTQIGLVAQEVELVSPGLVTESPDRDEDGNDLGTVTKSVNYSVLYMKAVKALQEAMERIETLEARLTAAGID